MRSTAIIIISILLLNFTCEKSEVYDADEVEYISYGTSFGMCYGYCLRVLVVSGGEAEFTKSAWIEDENYPDSACMINFFTDPLPGFLDQLNLDEFMNLDSIIGCPDCADGGSEWIEIGMNERVKRVTFEYHNEPAELNKIISSLRDLAESFNDCRKN